MRWFAADLNFTQLDVGKSFVCFIANQGRKQASLILMRCDAWLCVYLNSVPSLNIRLMSCAVGWGCAQNANRLKITYAIVCPCNSHVSRYSRLTFISHVVRTPPQTTNGAGDDRSLEENHRVLVSVKHMKTKVVRTLRLTNSNSSPAQLWLRIPPPPGCNDLGCCGCQQLKHLLGARRVRIRHRLSWATAIELSHWGLV